MYCKKCGKEIHEDAIICIHCGCQIKRCDGYDKKWLTTLLLCVFLGGIGAHRFYTGHIGIGIIQLLTAGGCGIWWLIDLIMIICGSYKDINGQLIAK